MVLIIVIGVVFGLIYGGIFGIMEVVGMGVVVVFVLVVLCGEVSFDFVWDSLMWMLKLIGIIIWVMIGVVMLVGVYMIVGGL